VLLAVVQQRNSDLPSDKITLPRRSSTVHAKRCLAYFPHDGLNKGEARNALARALFFNQLGELRDRRFENQAYRASGLNLLVAAVILWNTRYLQSVITTLGISDDLARHIAPLGWEHISLTGDYRWNVDEQPEAGALRPLRVPASLLVA
jgi:hypothetical protein